MYRCSSSHCNMVGSCTCGGVFHSQSNSFSMLFNHHRPFDEAEMYSFTPSSSSSCSSVDCTLSLGTPSTRLTNNDETEKRVHHDRRSGSRMSNFCWDILQQSKHTASPPPTHKAGRGSNTNNSGGGGGDPLLARRCANCDTTSTPLWRNGPRGPKSLCNACGIRFKKEERRASAATVSTTTYGGAGSGGGGVMEPPQHMMNNSWVQQHSHSQKMPCFSPATTTTGNEFSFIDDDRDSDTGIPFLSWRLNVTDRPSLVHDFTR
ncbi:GATA transcription factor 19 [Camellia sinensis]|uniref:GATA transcription factor 19 n=1 Tax=Camellia sinensis TaxID=4442 RepID=UPI001036CF32|nr:GATA transcription factor 19 [Camellia sinensis]